MAILGVGQLAVEAAVAPGHGLVVVVPVLHLSLAPAEVPRVRVAQNLLRARLHQDSLPSLVVGAKHLSGALQLLADLVLRRTGSAALAVTAKTSFSINLRGFSASGLRCSSC